MAAVKDFKQLTDLVATRVEAVDVKNFDAKGNEVEPLTFYVREMDGATTMGLMKRSPNTIKGKDGSVMTDNATNKLGMAYVLSRTVVKADDFTKALMHNEKAWDDLPVRILNPLFKMALELSDLADDDEVSEENEGKEEASS